ncbi:MAG: flagellar hook-length control protein FliK [Clostridium sp.]
MDITKMLIKEKVQVKSSNSKESNSFQGKETSKEVKNFNEVLEKQKSVIKNEKETKTETLEKEVNVQNKDVDLKVEELDKLLERIPELSDEELDKVTEEILSILLLLMNNLSNDEPMEELIPKNSDGTINVEELNILVSEEKPKNIDGLKNISSVKKEELNAVLNVLDSIVKEASIRLEVKPESGINNDKLGELVNNLKEFIKNPEEKIKGDSLKDEIKNLLNLKVDENSKSEDKVIILDENSSFEDNDSSSQEDKNITSKVDKNLNSKEEKFLNSLISEENKSLDKFSVNAFKANFGRIDAPVQKEAPVITKSNAVFDMIKTVKFMQTNALKELTVKIYPKELGEITISISQDKDVMKANIKANTKDAYTLLNNNLVEIKKSLGEQNIKIQEVNISLYNDDTTFYREGEENRKSLFEEEMKKGKVNGIIHEDEEEEISLYDGNVNALA